MDSLLTKLPSKQADFASFNLLETTLQGHNLIEASAGTGKTFTITRIFIRLLLENELPISSILVVTFTEAATYELRERIYSLLKESLKAFSDGSSEDPLLKGLLITVPVETAQSLLNKALANFDSCAIYTIHGFCQRVLFDYSFESGLTFGATMITDQDDLIKEAAYDFWRISFYDNSMLFINYLMKSKITPDTFIELYNKSKNYYEISTIPDTYLIDFKQNEEALLKHISQLKDEWNYSKHDIEQLLSSKSLKASKYTTKIRYKMIATMDLFCDTVSIDPQLFKYFENFTTSVIISNTKKNEQVIKHHFFDTCEEIKEIANDLCEKYDRQIEYLLTQSIDYINKHLTTKKSNQNILYFDDLLRKVYQTLNDENNENKLASAITKKYSAALIDEFQDTDPIQYSIFYKIFRVSKSILFLIGDPKQAIYSFRGADIFTYLFASKQVTSQYSLNTNYRSSPELVSAVSFLFSLSENPFLFEQIQYNESNSGVNEHQHIVIEGVKHKPLKIWFMSKNENSTQPKENLIQRIIAAEIAKLTRTPNCYIGSQQITASNFAIIVRTNAEALLYQETLSELSIPSVVDSNRSVFTTLEAQEVYSLLCAISEPVNTSLINAALTLPFFGLNSTQIEAGLADEQIYDTYLDLFDSHHSMWLHNGFDSMISSFFKEISIREKILRLPSGERKLTNYLHIIELINREFIKGHKRISTLLSWLGERINKSSSNVSDDEIIRLESDSDAVKILTVHKSKGLEFDIVFCPSIATSGSEVMSKSPYICHQKDNKPILVIGQKERDELRSVLELETLAENLRLFYVAITRAKYGCYLIYDDSEQASTSALSYLLFGNDIPSKNVSFLKEKVQSLTDGEIWSYLKELSNLHQSISVEFFTEFKTEFSAPTDTHIEQLTCRSLNKTLPEPWKIASYSWLAQTHSIADWIDDIYLNDEKADPIHTAVNKLDSLSIFNFPKGSKAGTFLHDLLEIIDLSSVPNTNSLNELITVKLLASGFDECWAPTITELINSLSTIKLSTNDKTFSLSQIASHNCCKEMEFYFPLKSISPMKIIEAFESQMNLFSNDYIGEGLKFQPISGYMKGFVDMIFLHDNMYYIVDWKSNYLGNDLAYYRYELLESVMKKEHYHLQYYIYSVAIHQYFKQHIAGYSYKKNFGGVFYLFLRGISPGSDTGIYFSKPDYSIIENLSKILVRV